MDTFQEDFKNFMSNLQELTECPVCFCRMSSTLKLCSTGHGVCENCAVKIEKCPTCQEPLGKGRNILLEKVLECLPIPCPNKERGCKTIMFGKDHSLYCPYREVECKLCGWKGCAEELLEHVDKVEWEGYLSDTPSETTDFVVVDDDKDETEYRPIRLRNKLFWYVFSRDSQTKMITLHSFYYPLEKPTDNYYLNMTLKKGENELSYRFKVFTDSDQSLSQSDAIKFAVPDFEKPFAEGKSIILDFNIKIINEQIS